MRSVFWFQPATDRVRRALETVPTTLLSNQSLWPAVPIIDRLAAFKEDKTQMLLSKGEQEGFSVWVDQVESKVH